MRTKCLKRRKEKKKKSHDVYHLLLIGYNIGDKIRFGVAKIWMEKSARFRNLLTLCYIRFSSEKPSQSATTRRAGEELSRFQFIFYYGVIVSTMVLLEELNTAKFRINSNKTINIKNSIIKIIRFTYLLNFNFL